MPRSCRRSSLITILMGTMLESFVTIVILAPLLLPVALQLGIDPLQYGIVMTEAFGIGIILPPIGIALYVACAISGARSRTRKQAAAVVPARAARRPAAGRCCCPAITTVLPDLAQFQVLASLRGDAMDDTEIRVPSPRRRDRHAPRRPARWRRAPRSPRALPLLARAFAPGGGQEDPLRASRADRARLAHLGRAVQEDDRGQERRQDQVQIFPNAQMGNERDTAQAVRIGSIEMGAIGVGLMNWVPEMSITDAPFLWKSRAQCYKAIAARSATSCASARSTRASCSPAGPTSAFAA